jgi:hypothetical protein
MQVGTGDIIGSAAAAMQGISPIGEIKAHSLKHKHDQSLDIQN